MKFIRRHWLIALAVVFTAAATAIFIGWLLGGCALEKVEARQGKLQVSSFKVQVAKLPAYPPGHEHATATGRLDARHGARQAFEAKLDAEFTPRWHFRADRTQSASNAVAAMKRFQVPSSRLQAGTNGMGNERGR